MSGNLIDASVAVKPCTSLTSVEVPAEFGRILNRHRIDRVVTFSSAGGGAKILKRMAALARLTVLGLLVYTVSQRHVRLSLLTT